MRVELRVALALGGAGADHSLQCSGRLRVITLDGSEREALAFDLDDADLAERAYGCGCLLDLVAGEQPAQQHEHRGRIVTARNQLLDEASDLVHEALLGGFRAVEDE